MCLWALVAFGCVAEPDAPMLQVIETLPADGARWPAAEPLRIRFDGYLNPSQNWSALVELVSGDLTEPVSVGYDPVDRALVVVPALALEPGLGYTLTVLAQDGARGMDGRALEADVTVQFIAEQGAPTTALSPVDFDRDLAPIIAARCGCHGPDLFPDLTGDALIALDSRRHPSRRLVWPGRPLRSHLLERMLPDYPGVWGRSMPPDGPLSAEELRLFVRWIDRLEPT